MLPNNKQSEKMEFAGRKPKNMSIAHRVRDHGYMDVMFNHDDFIDAVVWATNVVYEYDDYFNSHSFERVVISLEELPFEKRDIENAHMLLLIYYNMRQNFVLVEKIKQSLYTVARFQKIDEEDAAIMKKIGERMAEAARHHDGDFNFGDVPEFAGGEKKYNSYSHMVTLQIEKYMEECVKAKV